MSTSEQWYHVFNDMFFMTIGGLFFGFLTKLAACKYKKLSCCGLVIERESPPAIIDDDIENQSNGSSTQLRTPTRNDSNASGPTIDRL